MKNTIKIVILLSLGMLLQNCTTNGVENDFSYENLTDTISGSLFRNRKYDYARVKVSEEPALKIPTGLNGEKINPALKLPDGDNNYARSQVTEAQKQMLPPNYSVKFDMAKIINDQILKVSISVIYDDTGSLKLVFREPLPITINLLENYFKENLDNYIITAEKDEILSGHLITIRDTKKDLIFVILARKVDELSSLVKVNAVFINDGKTLSPNHIDESVRILSGIRKDLNNTELKNDNNIQIAKQVGANLVASEKSTKNGRSSLEGLLGSKKSTFVGSYDRTIYNSLEQQKTNTIQEQQDYTQAAVPADDNIYDSQTQAQVLNT
ncbi:hypothetical protein ACH24_01400 [Francisella persica ATCC VR-331]|uniref:Uncharacterized protein n=1 Tax=Francisella persica ATCC VR-331 TaxID=1086726 RepID=A0AAC8VD55_9GAMM|nr:hypothetical protein [Francisella persica]ALB01445.1 hypothetical protein ACH24_01400 [Francisella persica ATCC VR-331]ANH77735.1 hypothetical protein FSC845_04210 [Francisella persica ATCC VR-331]